MTPRERLESIIETAIDLLDRLDGDSDLEDDGTSEPSLDPSVGHDGKGAWFWAGDDREGSADECAA